jgi:hypothetical protein
VQSGAAGTILSSGAPPDFLLNHRVLIMQDDVDRDAGPWHFPAALPFSLVLAGCGGGGDATSSVVSSPTLVAAPQRAVSKPSQTPAQNTPPSKGAKSPPESATDDPAVRLLESPSLGQISALPHLSALSAHEKAGLLVQLPGKSASERMALINMYPSLVQLPEQQKQILLDKLEKIVPVTASPPR